MAAEAESWDADFADGGGAKEERTDVLLPARLRERAGGHEVGEDWDADFDADETPTLQVKGRTADRIDPGAQDSEWTDDFAWGERKPSVGTAAAPKTEEIDLAEKFMKRRKTDAASLPTTSATVMTARERTLVRLKELLPAIPEPVLSDDAFLRSSRPEPTIDMLLPPPLAPDAVLAFGEQLHTLQEAASLAAQKADKISEASIRNDLSVLLTRAGRSTEAARESEAVAASMTGGIGRPGWEAVHSAILNASRAAARTGDNAVAIEHALKALTLADEREASAQAGQCHQLLGALLFSSDPDGAAMHFAAHLKASCLATLEDRKAWRELGVSCWHVARLLQGMNEAELAEKYAGRAVDSAAKARDSALFTATSSLYDSLVAARGSKVRSPDEKEEVEWGTDWDAELGNVEPVASKDTPSKSGASVYMVADRSDGDVSKPRSDITIVKYPAPSLLYSLRPNEGHRLFSEERQEEWLSSLLTRHPRALALLSIRRTGQSQVPRKSDAYQRKMAKLIRNSPEALMLILAHAVELCIAGARLQAWGIISDNIAWSGTDLTAQLGDKEDNYLLVLSLLHVAARLCHTEREARYVTMISAAQVAFPRHSLALGLLQLEALAHHGRATAAQFRAHSSQAKAANDNGTASHALADMYLLLRGLSPLSTAAVEGALDDGPESEDLSPEEQTLMEAGYASVTPPQAQAKVAFVLGHQAAHLQGNHKLAERLFLESVYLLDSTRSMISFMPPLLCELGSNALVQLGEVLLYNLKYRYAVQALSSALLSYRLRAKRLYYPLLHRLASIAADQQDLRRAVQLYHEILAHYTEERKVTEAVYVSEILSKLHSDAGELRAAEHYLQDALALLPPITDGEKVDQRAFQLLMKLSSLYLLSYRSDRAIDLLEKLKHMEPHLPAGKAPAVYLQLAEAYLAKEWFEDARVALKKADEMSTPTGFRRTGNASALQLGARLALKTGRYAEALGSVEAALKLMSEFNLNGLARLHYMRGKILQAAAHPSARISFPFMAQRLDNEAMGAYAYTRSGEVLAECGAAYTKAYKLYRAAGDDKWVAKTVSRIAQAYLERLVSPMLLLHMPFERLAQLTASTASLPGRLTHLTYEEVEAPAALALDLSAEIPAPFLSLRAQLNVAELRLLRGEKATATTLAKDCIDTLMGLFVEPASNIPVLRNGRPAFLRKLLALFQRTARIVICLGGDIAAQSGGLLDAMLQLETALGCARRRSAREGTGHGTTGLGRQKFRGAGLAAPAKANQPAIKSDFPSALPLRDTIRAPRGAVSPVVSASNVSLSGSYSSRPHAAVEALEGERAASLAMDEAAEQVWSSLQQLKPLAANYVNGRITQEDALQQGRRVVQSIARTLQALRSQCAALRRGLAGSGQSSPRSRIGGRKNAPRIEELIASQGSALSRLLYVLQLDEYVVFFAPVAAQVRAVRFGGQEHVLDEAPGSVGPAEMVPVRITCYDSNEEYMMLSVRADTLVERLSTFLLKGEWREALEIKDKKKSVSHAPEDIRVISTSRLFSKNFARMMLAQSKCVIAGRQPAGTAGFYSLQPLARSLIDVFGASALANANANAPIQLSICLPTEPLGKAPIVAASAPPPPGQAAPAAGPDPSRTKLSRNVFEYLFRTLYIPPEGEPCDPAAARDELRIVFSSARSLATSLPQAEARAPLTLLVTGALNALPWELLFDEAVVRAPTLSSLLSHDLGREPAGPPLFLVPYYSDSAALGEKGAAAFETRKEWAASCVRADLRLSLPMPSASRVLANELLPTPLVKWGKKQPKGDKKALPYVSYIDVSAIEHPTDLGYVLESQASAQPVFVASLTDLVYPTEALQFLISSHCTLLFVPEVRLRSVVTRLTSQQERLLKSNQRALRTNKELASLLLAAAASASTEEHVPVVIINLPR